MRLAPVGLALVVAAVTATAAPPFALAAPPVDPAAPAAPAAPAPPAASPNAPPDAPAPTPAEELRALRARPSPTFHLLGTLFFGEGFRFNNPYRLETQLGDSAKTVSVTAPYLDLGLGLAIGDAFGIQHGAALRLSVALSGVGQAVLAPTYLATYRGASERFVSFARLGPAILLTPDTNVGGELGLGGAVFVTAKAAVTAEIVADLFYGAATRDAGFPVYPVVSLQLGLLLDHEVLP